MPQKIEAEADPPLMNLCRFERMRRHMIEDRNRCLIYWMKENEQRSRTPCFGQSAS